MCAKLDRNQRTRTIDQEPSEFEGNGQEDQDTRVQEDIAIRSKS